jgi:hypothetical protein
LIILDPFTEMVASPCAVFKSLATALPRFCSRFPVLSYIRSQASLLLYPPTLATK